MKINTRVLGEIELADDQVIDMPSGMIGFPALIRYALLSFSDPEVPFKYWQCVDDPSMCFIMVDPALFFPDYEITVPAEDLDEIELKSAPEGTVYVVVTIPSDPREMTANLMGPVVINQSANKAKQLVLSDPSYTSKHRVLKQETPGHACADSEKG
jgi:flagellar assembly factor FliW